MGEILIGLRCHGQEKLPIHQEKEKEKKNDDTIVLHPTKPLSKIPRECS